MSSPADPFLISLCFLLMFLPSNISKYFFGFAAIVHVYHKIHGLSMCSNSKWPNFFRFCFFLAPKLSQYSCDLSNVLCIFEEVITSNIISLYVLSSVSLLGSEINKNLLEELSVSVSMCKFQFFKCRIFWKFHEHFHLENKIFLRSRLWSS